MVNIIMEFVHLFWIHILLQFDVEDDGFLFGHHLEPNWTIN